LRRDVFRLKTTNCVCGGSCPRCQAKSRLRIGLPDDAYEREADQVADRVMQTTPGDVGSGSAPTIQRKSISCREGTAEGERDLPDKRRLAAPMQQRDETSPSPEVDSVLRSPGRSLDARTRDFFEPRIGFDLASVRIHSSDAAATATTALDARAFTLGRDIAFAPGEFRPDTPSGQWLIAHELAHVAQQGYTGASLIQRQPTAGTSDWQKQLDDILPRRRGLLVDIDRVVQLMERFSTNELGELVGLIRADPDVIKFTRDEAGVPAMFALYDTRVLALSEGRVSYRLDLPAARFLLSTFPTRRSKRRESDEARAEVYSEDVVHDAYIRYHHNAWLPKDKEAFPSDVPPTIRRNCIAIIHDMLPKLFSSEAKVKQIRKRLAALRAKGETFTMVHTGDTLAGAGVASARTEIRFKDGAGAATNGNTEPKTLSESAWNKVMSAVGSVYGWHIFGMALMDGYHSVTLFVDNQPGTRTLYWADQWAIEAGDDFKQVAGAISGFRKYEQKGFDDFIEIMTNAWWNDVHSPGSKCGKSNPKKWDSACRYNATLMLWHLRRSAEP
jgi:hypothetical protein